MFVNRIAMAAVALCATVAAAQQSTTVTASAPQTTVDYSVPVTLTGVVNGGTSPTGSMRFSDPASGTDVTVPLSNRTASYTATNLASGYHPFTVAYLGDGSNLASSSSLGITVRAQRAAVLSVTPSHLPAGSLDSLIRIEGTGFLNYARLTINGAPVDYWTVDSDTTMRTFLTPAMLAAPGTLSIAVTNDGASTTTPPPAPFVFTIDPAGPPPLSLAFAGPVATASPVTPGGNTAWLVLTKLTDQMTNYYSVWTKSVTDTNADGVVAIDSTQQQPPLAELPPGTTAAVVDIASGAIRIDVPPAGQRLERFFPADGVRGVRNGEVTRLFLPSSYWALLVVRPGVGAWFANYSLNITPRKFQPLQGSPPAPATFLPDDVLVAVGPNVVTRARLGDYMPHPDPATPGLIAEDADVVEGDSGFSQLLFNVRLSSASASPVTVTYQTDPWLARDDDFTGTSGTLTFEPGETLKTVAVNGWGDRLYEFDEELRFTLLQATGAPILHALATGTILNDDAIPTVSVGDAAAVVEGTALSTKNKLVFPLTLSEASGDSVSLTFTVLNGGAGNADLDFTTQSQVSIPAGATTGSWIVPIRSDSDDEDDEVLNVKVTTVFGAVLGRAQASGIILDDDAPPVLTPQAVAVREGTGADTTINVPILVSGTSAKPVSVDYELVANGTASAADFVAARGTLNVTPTAFAINVIPITIKADSLAELTETFSLVLSNAANATLAQTSISITIDDDESPSGDFDGNGSSDLVLRNASTGANALWLLNGTSYSSTVNLPYLPGDFRIEGSADFDRDGWNDLLLRNYANGNNALWLMNGTALKSIVNLPWLPTASDFRFEGTGDLNGDGSPDILIRNYTNGNNAVWLMNGSAFSGVANLPALPDTNYRMAGSGDFNADGKADVVWRNRVTGNNAVWLMNGMSLSGIANLPALTNTDYRFNAIADYDGDGKTDIVLRNYTTGANAIWLLDGVALKSIANLPALPNTAYEIVGPR